MQRIASRAAAPFPRSIRDDLIDEAPTRLWMIVCRGRAAYRAEQGSFEGWFATVIRNQGVSRTRPRRLGRLEWPDGLPARPGADHAAADELSERFDHLRQLLDVLCDDMDGRTIDWHGVLLLQLRVALTIPIARTRPVAPPQGEVAAQVERLLPWRPAEAGRVISSALPPLGQVWEALAPALDLPPHRLSAAQVCAAVGVSRACWLKWVNRAKEQARERIAPVDWDRCFARLLPDHDVGIATEE